MQKNDKQPIVGVVKNTNKGTKEVFVVHGRHKLTISQRASDRLTKGMGSWAFLIIFGLYLAIWMSLNIYGFTREWDPYPFILLNLTLSCLAAIQAPIILMSQNRQTERDRVRSEYDYAVNRKAEREIQQIQKDLASIKKILQKKS